MPTFHLFHLEVKTLSSSSSFLLVRMSWIYIINWMPYYKITSSINKGTSIFNSHFLHSYIKVGFKPYHHQFGCQEECKIAYFIVRVITCIQVCVLYLFLYRKKLFCKLKACWQNNKEKWKQLFLYRCEEWEPKRNF